MSTLAHPIIVGIVVALISALITYTVTSISTQGAIRKAAEIAVVTHERIKHQESFETMLAHHKVECGAAEKLRKIEKVVLAIYARQGGKIEELDI